MKKFMLIFLFLFSSNCFATLITSDDVYDDGTFEWLHFNFTYSMTSADSLSTYTGEGFRLATAVEAQDLINDWFGTNLSLGSYQRGMDTTTFVAEFYSTSHYAYGIVADGGLFGAVNSEIYVGYSAGTFGLSGAAFSYAGYMMVRDSSSDVPEPSTLAILVFSLIGLASRRQYKKAFKPF